MKVHQAIARSLADHGVDTLFGLIGDGNLYMANSFVQDCGGRFVQSAHEVGAVLMALGYASVSGKVGAATVTHGPALTNTVTALTEGVRARLPIVLLCGDTRPEDRDAFQKIAQREVVMATGAGFELLRSPRTVSIDLVTAFRRAATEHRPIVFNMPIGFQWDEAEPQPAPTRWIDNRAVVPESVDLDDAVGIIAAAKRPVIVAGRGAAGAEARAALLRLAARIGAPVGTTLKGKGLFAGEPFDLGVCGTLSTPPTVEVLLASDCLITFGASLNKYTLSDGTFVKGKRIVQVTSDIADIGRYCPVDAGLFGDAARTADLILHWLDEAEIPSSGYRDAAMQAALDAYSPGEEFEAASDTLDLREVLHKVNLSVPQDRIFVSDGGRFLPHAWKIIDVAAPNALVHTVNFGAIGSGMAEAVGAALAAPDRPVLLVTGDGGFMLGGLNEFNTAVRNKLDLVVVVCNDSAYGAEHIQYRRKGLDPSLALFDWPEFADVANALGGRGFTARTAAELDAVLAALPMRSGPVLIDVKLDPDAIPSLI